MRPASRNLKVPCFVERDSHPREVNLRRLPPSPLPWSCRRVAMDRPPPRPRGLQRSRTLKLILDKPYRSGDAASSSAGLAVAPIRPLTRGHELSDRSEYDEARCCWRDQRVRLVGRGSPCSASH